MVDQSVGDGVIRMATKSVAKPLILLRSFLNDIILDDCGSVGDK